MVTLALLQLIINFIDYLLTHLFNPIYSALMNLGTTISGLQVPAIIYSTLSIVIYFLPMSTILILFNITITLVGIAFLLAAVYVCLDLVKKIPFL